MATKKKAKRRTKRKKTRASKRATRSKTKAVRKRPAKKAPVRRASPKKAKTTAKGAVKATPATPPAQPARPVAATRTPSPPPQSAPPGECIGVVTHYYSHLSVAILRLETGTLGVGDTIHIRGHTTDFRQKIESLEVEHAPVTQVGPNDEFGLKVVEHAREHDVVYKVRQ